jgi:hypothetical protein
VPGFAICCRRFTRLAWPVPPDFDMVLTVRKEGLENYVLMVRHGGGQRAWATGFAARRKS